MQPIQLAPNTLKSFYPGAGRIAGFRRDPDVDPAHAEDWIASTTTRFGAAPAGLSRLPDGSLLADRFMTDPESWFGSDYTARYGPVGTMLVKLLDAGDRLPLHIHPDRVFARQHLGSDLGKSEAWLILHAEPGASAHLGFSRDVTSDELSGWVKSQNATAMLSACNQVPVRSGDVFFCPGGVPHAIGTGIFMVEVQEMTDFSIMLEWSGFPLDPAASFLGLERDVALGAVSRNAITGTDLHALSGLCLRSLAAGTPGVTSLLPGGAAGLFSAEQIIPGEEEIALGARFSLLIVNAGAGTLAHNTADPVAISAGQAWLIPHSAGDVGLRGTLSAIRCYPAV